ncbi:MAG: hypothetical protein DRJ09_07040 [Bacteroidetes bacterium]|nr:MAG: hypothetical protein DRJ09_07040 [Bacteroidota bacterium]
MGKKNISKSKEIQAVNQHEDIEQYIELVAWHKVLSSDKFLGDIYRWTYIIDEQAVYGVDFLYKQFGLPVGNDTTLENLIALANNSNYSELLSNYIDFPKEKNGVLFKNSINIPNGEIVEINHAAWLFEKNGKREKIEGVIKIIHKENKNTSHPLTAIFPEVLSQSFETYIVYNRGSGQPVYVSPNFYQLFNINPGLFIDDLFFYEKMVAKGDVEKFQLFQEKTKKGIQGEVTVRFKQGNKVIWTHLKSVMTDTKFLSIIIKDVTEEQTARNLLDESENKYRTLIHQLPFVLIIHKDGVIRFVNEAGKKYSGSKRFRDIIGKNILDFVPPEFRERNIERMRKLEQGEELHYPYEEVILGSNGNQIPVKLYAEKIIFDGEVCNQLVLIDLSKEKEYLRHIKQQRGLLRLIIDKVPALLAYVSKDNDYLYINTAYARFYNKDFSYFIRKNAEDILPADYFNLIKDKLAEVKKGRSVEFEIERVNSDGKKILTVTKYIPHFDENDNVIAFLATIEDITEQRKAENDLKESEDKFRRIFKESLTPQLLISKDNKFIDLNNAACKLLGYPNPAGLLGKTPADISPKLQDDNPLSNESVLKYISKAIKDGASSFDWIHLTKDGKKINVHVTLTLLIINGNNVIHVVWVDISKRVAREKEIRKLSTTIEQSPISVVITNLDATIEYVNPFFQKVTGYSAEEVIGKNPNILKSGLTPFHTYIEMWKNLTDGEIWTGEFINKRKNGTNYIESCVIVPIKDKAGNIVNYVALKEDISKKREAEERLAESENKFKSLFYENKSIILMFDPVNGNILEANQAACDFYGYTDTEMVKKSVFDFNVKDTKELFSLLNKVRTGEQNHFLFKHKLKNSVIKDVELYTGILNSKKKEVFYSVIHDISDKIKAQQELEKAKEKAEESDRLKSAFLANMSHEIRTPMNAILGFGALLQDEEIGNEERNQFVDIINASGYSLLEIINDIIEMSKIEAGQISIHKKPTDINQLIKTVYNQHSLTASKKNIELRLNPDTFYSNQAIMLDETKIKQILVNLLNNAIKFTDEGFVEMGYRIADKEIEFYVKDSGIGISRENHHLVFDRFNKITWDTDGKKVYPGTGLGLSISKAFVEKMEGKIWLTSEKGKGTTFYFSIPLEVTEQPAFSYNNVKIAEDFKLDGKVILVAEDEEKNFQYFNIFLTKLGAKVLHAFSGKEVIEIVDKEFESIDLIFMDIKMPEIDGYEATRIIKKKYPFMPIIAQTAYAFSDDKAKALEAGCDDYISKPVAKGKLIALLRNYF